jgi:hypothetical protein
MTVSKEEKKHRIISKLGQLRQPSFGGAYGGGELNFYLYFLHHFMFSNLK